MSRIGYLPITLPAGVTVSEKDNVITVKGPKGELTQKIDPIISVSVEGNEVKFTRPNEDKETKSKHGLYRALINNMVKGVSEGYKVEMELVGVGYRAQNQGQVLELTLGYSHAIYLVLPPEIKVETKNERNQTPRILLECIDKQLLGQVCAKIRTYRAPEPYKGKGIKFMGEQIRRKAGKAAGAK